MDVIKCQRCGNRFDPAFGNRSMRLCADCYAWVHGLPNPDDVPDTDEEIEYQVRTGQLPPSALPDHLAR